MILSLYFISFSDEEYLEAGASTSTPRSTCQEVAEVSHGVPPNTESEVIPSPLAERRDSAELHAQGEVEDDHTSGEAVL